MELTKLTQLGGSPARKLYKDIADAIHAHTSLVNNPHKTTATQVGLGNVPNWTATSSVSDASDVKFSTAGAVKKAYDRGTAGISRAELAETNAKKHTDAAITKLMGGAPAAALDTIKELADAMLAGGSGSEVIATNLANHKADKANPHGTTKTHVGLSAVNNWEATSAINDASGAKYATALAAKTAYDRGTVGINNASAAQARANAAYSLAETKITKAQGDGYYLGKTAYARGVAGEYVSGGAQTPDHFGGGNLRLNMLKLDTTYSDALWLSSYNGDDVKLSNVLLFNKATAKVSFRQQAYDSKTWGAEHEFYTTAKKPTNVDIGLSNINNWTATSAVNDASTTKYATAAGVKSAYDRGTVGITNAATAQTKANSAYSLAETKITKAQGDGYYLGKTAKAVDSDKLDGLNSTDFSRSNHVHAGVINQPIALGTTDLDTLSAPDTYFQDNTANATTARHYPEANAGSLLVLKGLGVTHVYRVANSSRVWSRSKQTTTWTAWARVYDTVNKPSKNDVGLGSVPNYAFVHSVTDASTTKFASTGSVKIANDRANVANARAELAETNAKKHTDAAITKLMGGAPAAALDTIKELADALTSGNNAAGVITANLTAHKADKANPHGTTKVHVGLSNINNWTATGAVNDASTTKYATAVGVKTAYDRGTDGINRANNAQTKANSAYDLANSKITKAQGDGYYLGKTAKAADADKLDGLNSSDFSRSNHVHAGVVNQPIALGTTDLDTLKAPNTYYQDSNANSTTARHYPEANAGALQVLKNAGVTQVYHVYNGSRVWTRSFYGTAWTAWARTYDTINKPTKADVSLSSVNNWGATSATNSTSATTYATAAGVKAAYDRGSVGVAHAATAQTKANSAYDLANSKITKAQGDGYYLGKTAKASDADKLDGLNSTDFARAAHTHTPAQVGLGNVPNWTATSSVSDASNTKFATAGAVKLAHDRGLLGVNNAAAAKAKADNAFSLASSKITKVQGDSYYAPKANQLINGDMAVSQRGSRFTVTGFTADRWLVVNPSVVDISINTPPVRETGYKSLTVTKKVSDTYLCQSVELPVGAENRLGTYLNNRMVSFSFDVYPYDGITEIEYVWILSPDTLSKVIFGSNIKLKSRTWNHITLTKRLSGFKDGVAASHYVARVDLPEKQAGVASFTNVKVEFSDVSTPFVPDHYSINLVKCQRYYSIANGHYMSSRVAGQSRYRGTPIYFPTSMRTIPTVQVLAYTTSNPEQTAGYRIEDMSQSDGLFGFDWRDGGQDWSKVNVKFGLSSEL